MSGKKYSMSATDVSGQESNAGIAVYTDMLEAFCLPRYTLRNCTGLMFSVSLVAQLYRPFVSWQFMLHAIDGKTITKLQINAVVPVSINANATLYLPLDGVDLQTTCCTSVRVNRSLQGVVTYDCKLIFWGISLPFTSWWCQENKRPTIGYNRTRITLKWGLARCLLKTLGLEQFRLCRPRAGHELGPQ